MSGVSLKPDEDGVIRLSGVLGVDTVAGLHGQTARVFSGGDADVVVDASAVEAGDSAGVALLLEWLGEGRRRGRRVAFQGLPERLLAIARLSGVDDLLTGERDRRITDPDVLSAARRVPV